jgi:hypothetical protein
MRYQSILGKTVELTSERKKHIIQHHPDVTTFLPKIKKVLLIPDQIRIDNYDPRVLLFYKYFDNIDKGKFLVVVFKINERNFILTFYSTHRIKSGEKYEI